MCCKESFSNGLMSKIITHVLNLLNVQRKGIEGVVVLCSDQEMATLTVVKLLILAVVLCCPLQQTQGVVNITCQNTQVLESAETANIIITRSGSSQDLSATHGIECNTRDDTAVAPDDYSTASSTITFTSDQAQQQMSISIINDNEPEGNETFRVTCTSTNSDVKIQRSCTDVVVTIQNDDSRISFCPDGYATQVREDIGTFTVEICREGVLSSSPSIQFCRISEGGISPSVSTNCSSAVFATDSNSTVTRFTIKDDDVGEKELQTFNIFLNSSDPTVTSTDTKEYGVTIQDNDNTFYLDTTNMQVTEGVGLGDVNITIQREGEISAASMVSLELVFTATAESADCNGTSPRVIQFDAGVTSRTITACRVVDDRLVEDDETFKVKISGVGSSNVRTRESERTIKLISDDVKVTCHGVSVKEDDRDRPTVKLDRTGATAITSTTILCSTADGTAVSPTDYIPQKSTAVFFRINDVTKNISFAVRGDNEAESNETFTVTCTTSDPRVVVDPSCTGVQITIINDDTSVFFCPGYQTSMEVKTGTYTVRVCRFGVLEDTHTVRLCISSESVSPPNQPAVQTRCDDIIFTAYDEVKQLVIPVRPDALAKKDSITIKISMNTTDVRVTLNDTTSYNVTIYDDYSTFYLTNVTVLSKTEGVGSADVNVTINRVGRTSMGSNVSLELVFTATAESADCTGTSPRVIQFDAGVTSRTVTACTVVDDRLVEDDETFKVKVSGVGSSNVRTGEFERTIKLISDDVNITCQGVAPLREADGPATVRLNRAGGTSVIANNVLCSTADGTAISPTDYQSKTSATVSFELNDVIKNISFVVKDDNVPEANKTFTVTCTTSDPRVVVDPSCTGVQINIINDDTYMFFCPGYSTSIEENSGFYTVRLCRVGVLEATHTVRICRSSDSVSSPHDYPSVQAQCDDIVFAAYNEVKELVISVNNDTWGEQEYKTFNISMNTTDVRVTFNDTTSYVVTIHDDDSTFYLMDVTELSKTEGVGSADVNVTINRVGRTSESSNVSLQLVFNATAESADCTGTSLRVIQFDAGVTSKSITACTVVDDRLVEEDETFKVMISGVARSSNVRTGKSERTIKLISNDANIFCRNRSRVPQSVYENEGPVLMEFTREGSLQHNHTIRIRTISGTALPVKDYIAIDKTFTFAPNQTNTNETVVLVDDNVVEPDEKFRLSVTSSDDRVNMICPGTDLTILNDDTFIKCVDQNIEVGEGNKTVYFTFKREGVLNKSSPIWFSTKDGTAFDKADYMPRNKVNRTFLPGQVYMTIGVDLVEDEYKENNENFSVIIGSHVPKTLTSGDRCTLITIMDDEPNPEDRMTKHQAQELLGKERNLEILLGVAIAVMALLLLFFVFVFSYLLSKKS